MPNSAIDLPERLSALLVGGDARLPSPIGTAGYAVPDLAASAIHRIDADFSDPRIKIVGKPGTGNVIVIAPQKLDYKITITFYAGARNNTIVLGSNCYMFGEIDLRGNEGMIILGERAEWPAMLYARLSSDDETLFWGGRSKCNGVRITVEGKRRNVVIGEDCMFAPGTDVRTSDLHAIFSMDDGAWLNEAADVHLEPHVWIGMNAMVLKGATIGFGSIIGARSVVSKAVPRFSIAAGAPAKVIKSGVSWDSQTAPRPDYRALLAAQCAELIDRVPGKSSA